jgi:hypothetical protein
MLWPMKINGRCRAESCAELELENEAVQKIHSHLTHVHEWLQ